VLYQCALVQDIGMFEAGDATEVGEKGLTLRSVAFLRMKWGAQSSYL
jgi:hypothetical protein